MYWHYWRCCRCYFPSTVHQSVPNGRQELCWEAEDGDGQTDARPSLPAAAVLLWAVQRTDLAGGQTETLSAIFHRLLLSVSCGSGDDDVANWYMWLMAVWGVMKPFDLITQSFNFSPAADLIFKIWKVLQVQSMVVGSESKIAGWLLWKMCAKFTEAYRRLENVFL